MVKLLLYKDEKLELDINGICKHDTFVFDDYIFELENKKLIKKQNDYMYTFDFISNKCTIELLNEKYTLELNIDVILCDLKKDKMVFKYYVESMEDILNTLEIVFC